MKSTSTDFVFCVEGLPESAYQLSLMNLLNLTYADLVHCMRETYDRGDFHAAALYRSFYRSAPWQLSRIPQIRNTPQLLRRLQNDLTIELPHLKSQKTDDGVTKLVFQLNDRRTIETVVIPMANHATVCISCQVGCRMGCRFCQTGQMGWIRNLEPHEIVAQVYTVKVVMGIHVRNVVFMGMGEPMDNFDAVTRAIRVMEDQRGLDIARRHITVSTVGLPGGIRRLASLQWPQLKLALSLNAPNDALRSELMPVNRKYPMATLRQALSAYPLARGNCLFIEYVLIKGLNDAPGHASELAAYFSGLPVKLNLIPYNPGRNSPFQPPTAEDVRRFQQALIDEKLFVRLRSARGSAIRAACGQLGAGA